MQLFVSVLVVAISTGLLLVAFKYVVQAIKKLLREGGSQKRSRSAQDRSRQIIACQLCGARLRIPRNRGMLEITCPKCQGKFYFDSGKKISYDNNELSAYRKGGKSRAEIPANPTTQREALLALSAAWSASYVSRVVFDRNSDLWQMVKKSGGRIDYLLLTYTGTEAIFDIYFCNAPESSHTFRYTYNEIVGDSNSGTISLQNNEIDLVRRMTLSRIVDDKPNAKMKSGRIYA